MTPSPGWTRVHATALGATFGWAAMTGNEWPLLVTAVVLFAVWIWVARQRWTPQGRFGPANAITAVRFVLVLVVAALPGAWIVPWAGIAIAVFFTLDGVDGLVAHRTTVPPSSAPSSIRRPMPSWWRSRVYSSSKSACWVRGFFWWERCDMRSWSARA
ncbi:MAG: CDP-alcohol phosphatidyltransferase family protein [Nannocystaceae bacterium]|nr:CDP-alcohol phosphatidyltransferase family protein [Nannocystaceae bacterium]